MYEQFRDELMVKLSNLDPQMLKSIIESIDAVASGYKVEKRSTQLIVYQHGLPDVCKAYLVSRSIEGMSAKTVDLYKNVLTRFFLSITIPIQRISTNDIRVWLYRYEERHSISKRTMELYRLILNGFFAWTAAQGWTQSNPCSQIKPIKYVKKPRKAMSQLELEYIRSSCKSKQELAVIQMLYSTGCRVSELAGLKLSDINWEKRQVMLFGKGGKYRIAYLNAKAIVALKRYLSSRNDNDEHLIVSVRSPHHMLTRGGLELIIRNIAERVQDKVSVPVTPHVFRRTTATIALQNGMPIQSVQLMLGHRNINTTMTYAEVCQDSVKQAHVSSVI